MKRILFAGAALVLAFVAAPTAQAASHGSFGLGIMLGDPNGLNAKLQFDDATSLDFGVGFGLIGGEHLHIQADFLFEFDIDKYSAGELEFYVGVGPKLGLFFKHDDLRIGARAPLGLTFFFDGAPVDVFIEIAAGLWLIDDVDFDLDAAIGVRYWF